MKVTFAELYDALTARGLEVGIAERGGGHAITVHEPADGRAITLLVARDFDHAAHVLVMSIRLREGLASRGRMPDLRARDRECCGRWPEFLELWPLRSNAG